MENKNPEDDLKSGSMHVYSSSNAWELRKMILISLKSMAFHFLDGGMDDKIMDDAVRIAAVVNSVGSTPRTMGILLTCAVAMLSSALSEMERLRPEVFNSAPPEEGGPSPHEIEEWINRVAEQMKKDGPQ